ncbi:MAG: sortase [Candidatus Roizmanbacteria bacterium]|nr:sortase [Candidatus Roizmanbacteria bacterium]
MALYRYVKAPPAKPPAYIAKKIISTSMMIVGIFLLVWVGYPIVSFELTSRVKYAQIVSPVPETQDVVALAAKPQSPPSESASETFSNFARSVSDFIPERQEPGTVQGVSIESTDTSVDYTKASNWFPAKPQSGANTAGRIYFLSIPKLKIKDAIVKIAGEDLDKTLIHYGGTGLPGEYGTSVIFGHSILPQFYDPENYKSIFSLLPKLEEGDEIFIKYDGVNYRYVVADMRIADAEDITVLEQRYDSSYIRLITCVPPGTYWKRLAVTARLQPI